MCHLRAGLKLLANLIFLLAVLVNRFAYLFLKIAGGKKIKNIGSARSVGLLAVCFQYGLYVVVQQSKWFTFFVFTWSRFSLSCRFTPAVSGSPSKILPLKSKISNVSGFQCCGLLGRV